MIIAGHRLAILAALFIAPPLAAQQSTPGHLPNEDLTSRSVPPAPPPTRYTPPPFPNFSRRPPKKATHAAAKSKHVVVRREARHASRKPAKAESQLSSRERKDRRWCSSLSRRQLSHNSKCRKILVSKKRAVEAPRHSTRQDRIDERRCGKLTLKQVLRDRRCRSFAQRQLAETSKAHHSSKTKKAVAQRHGKKSSAKQRQPKKRSRR